MVKAGIIFMQEGWGRSCLTETHECHALPRERSLAIMSSHCAEEKNERRQSPSIKFDRGEVVFWRPPRMAWSLSVHKVFLIPQDQRNY